MATWKKVIVSGSAANLSSLQVDNLTSGQVVIGGGTAGNLSTTAINGTGNIVATTNATGLVHSGSFSGSFFGDGSGLSGVAASFPVTAKTDLVNTDKFFINDGASKFTTYGDLLVDLAGTNLATQSNDSLTLASTITGLTSVSATGFTGSFTGSLVGALTGTASFANNATSASFASQAANATTASYVLQAVSASFATLAQTANTASYVVTAQTASYVLQAVSASFATNATSASFASNIASGLNISASSINVTNNLSVAGTASFGYVQQITGSAVIIGEEFIVLNTQSPAARFAGLQIYDSGSNSTSSIVWDSQNNHFIYSNASGSSYNGGGFIAGPRNTGSLGQESYPTLNRIVRGQGGDHIYDSNISDDNTIGINTQITGGLNVSAGITGSLLGTAATASYVLQAVSASFATLAQTANTASYVVTAQTASFVATASFAGNANLLDGLDSTIFATTGSNTFRANQIISGTLDVIPAGSATAELTVTSTGVKIGNIVSDIHTITGSVSVSGSVTATNFTGSILGTASFADRATSASFASTAQTANTASFVAAANVSGTVTSASYALTASFAQNGGTLNNALTFGTGLSGSASTFNGSTAVTVAISGSAALTTNTIPKWTGTGLANSLISETTSQVTIATGSVISAGGLTVTGNSTFNNNLTIAGDLAVNGTTTFINTTNTYVKDQFVLIASGSSTLVDAGIVAQYNAAGSGSTFFLDAAPGTYGRWAVAYDVLGTSTSVTADEYVVTAKISANSVPSAAPTWGGSGNGSGNIWIKNDTGDIYIYA
jgi:hypothetical protein